MTTGAATSAPISWTGDFAATGCSELPAGHREINFQAVPGNEPR
jgi:hypothetical protein